MYFPRSLIELIFFILPKRNDPRLGFMYVSNLFRISSATVQVFILSSFCALNFLTSEAGCIVNLSFLAPGNIVFTSIPNFLVNTSKGFWLPVTVPFTYLATKTSFNKAILTLPLVAATYDASALCALSLKGLSEVSLCLPEPGPPPCILYRFDSALIGLWIFTCGYAWTLSFIYLSIKSFLAGSI